MDDKMLKEDYDRICLKVRQNCQKIGNDLREFPAREDGDYFAPDRSSIRTIKHIFGWTQSFFTGMALLGQTIKVTTLYCAGANSFMKVIGTRYL